MEPLQGRILSWTVGKCAASPNAALTTVLGEMAEELFPSIRMHRQHLVPTPFAIRHDFLVERGRHFR